MFSFLQTFEHVSYHFEYLQVFCLCRIGAILVITVNRRHFFTAEIYEMTRISTISIARCLQEVSVVILNCNAKDGTYLQIRS